MTNETDPNGRAPTSPGAKLDAGKPRIGLIATDFPRALTEIARVGTFGARKYTDHGWLYVPNGIDRYTDAMLRHVLAEPIGAVDHDSGLLHAAHVAWNALARLELMLRVDPAGASGEIQQASATGRLTIPGRDTA